MQENYVRVKLEISTNITSEIEIMKIGILTYHRSRNYGAFLQAYSLCQKLNTEPGIKAEIINFRMQKEVNIYRNSIKKRTLIHPIEEYHTHKTNARQDEGFHRDFTKLKVSAGECIGDSPDDLAGYIKGKYDVVIVGSDEVWKTDGMRGFPTPYWLFGDLGCRKFAYAVSARSDFSKLSTENQSLLINAVNDFEFIGVRDQLTYDEVYKFRTSKDNIVKCCDPSFFNMYEPNKERAAEILSRAKLSSQKKTIAIMTEEISIVKAIQEKLSKDYNLIAFYQWHPGLIDLTGLSPFEWLDVMASVDMVMTSFFHAVCFGVQFGVPLIAFGTPRKSSKLIEVVKDIHREDIYVSDMNAYMSDTDISKKIELVINQTRIPYNVEVSMMAGYFEMLIKLRT